MDIRIHNIKLIQDTTVKAIISFVINGELAVHDVRLIQTDAKLFLSMPSQLINGVRRDIVHPIGSDLRKQMETMAIDYYNKTMEERQNG